MSPVEFLIPAGFRLIDPKAGLWETPEGEHCRTQEALDLWRERAFPGYPQGPRPVPRRPRRARPQ